MRAICEACQGRQPVDWRAGHLCVHCGGAVRAETRCAACTRWAPGGRFCRHCAAELVPDEWYGVGRMLHAAGVDGLSLAERVRALAPEQREVFSSRFASQRALIERRVADARFCEALLVTRGFADAFEDRLVGSLPWPAGSFDDDRATRPDDTTARLEWLHAHADFEVRQLAVLALVRRGSTDDAHLREVKQLARADEPLMEEAVRVLGLVRQRVFSLSERWSKQTEWLEAARACAGRKTGDAELALGLAVACEATGHERPDDTLVIGALRAGLASANEALRLGCAVELDEGAVLSTLLDSEDEALANRARRRLGRQGGALLAPRIDATRDGAELRELIRVLQTPLAAPTFEAVVRAMGRLEDPRDAIRPLTSRPWGETDAGLRDQLADEVAQVRLPLAAALDLLSWAIETKDAAARYRPALDVLPFVVAVGEAARADPPTAHDLYRFTPFLAAGPEPIVVDRVLEWLTAHPRETWRAILNLGCSSFDHHEPVNEDPVTRLFFAVWQALGNEGREAQVAPLEEALRSVSGSRYFERLQPRLVDALLEFEPGRAPLWRVLDRFHRDFEPQLRADARFQARVGHSAEAAFRFFTDLDLTDAPELFRRMEGELADDVALASVIDPAFACAHRLLQTGETRLGLWLASSVVAEIVNRFRDQRRRETWRAEVQRLPARCAALDDTRRHSTPRDPTDDVRGFVDHIETELRLAREVFEREADDAERERQRRAAHEAREAERARQEEDRQRQALEREAQARVALEQSVPQSTSELDMQVLVPQHALKTLRDYVTFMRALQKGADVMALFQQHGMTPQDWGACATAWSQVMSSRLEVAMRFAALLNG